MPVHTLDASAYTGLRKVLTNAQGKSTISSVKTRAPLMYGSYYRPYYNINVIQPGVTPPSITYEPVVVTLDFTTTFPGNFVGSKYVNYDLPYPTKSITITFTNLGAVNGNAYPEVDSATFDFQADGSQILFKNTQVTEKYDVAYFSTYGVYQDDINLTNGDVLVLTTKKPISGRILVGFYPN